MMFFSIIIPVYNRPVEIEELLRSLLLQQYKDFEVIVIEDGSEISCQEVVQAFASQIDLLYFYQANTGQGFARNLGMKMAKGDYFLMFDSDCIIPSQYLFLLKQAIEKRKLDAHGGPDTAGTDFSAFQKAMDFSMTSFWTTGGIRGKLKNPAKYQARGYNMGVSREVFENTGGFADPNKAEDIEWSIRIKKAGFKLELVQEAFVYHKRKNTLASFFKQGFSFGRNRIHVSRFQEGAVQLIHVMPLLFLLGILTIPFFYWINILLFKIGISIYLFWLTGLFIAASVRHRSVVVGVLAIPVSVLQLAAYGAGIAYEGLIRILRS